MEILDVILQKSYLHWTLNTPTKPRDEDVIMSLISVDVCFNRRITRQRFKKAICRYFKGEMYYSKTYLIRPQAINWIKYSSVKALRSNDAYGSPEITLYWNFPNNRNRNRKLQTSKEPLKSQAQGTSLFTSAASKQRGFPIVRGRLRSGCLKVRERLGVKAGVVQETSGRNRIR